MRANSRCGQGMKRSWVKLPLVVLLASHMTGLSAASLHEVWRDALSGDSQYTAARASLAAGEESATQGRAGLLPSVVLTANTVQNNDTISSVSDSYNSRAYELRLTQPLWRWQNWVAFDQAKLASEQAAFEFQSAQQALILRVADAYFAVLVGEENLRVVRAQKVAIGQQLELAKKSYEVGTATITDTHEAQARFDLAGAQEIAAKSALEISQRALELITGKAYDKLDVLRAKTSLPLPEPADMASWVAAAEADNPEVRVQALLTEQASREAERARAGHQPTLDLIATAGQNTIGANSFGTESEIERRTIGVYLTLPLFQGGATQSGARQASHRRDAAIASLDTARRNARQSARQAYLGVVNGLAQVKAREAAVASSEAALASNRLGYEVGVRINIDVLNAEQQLSAARRDLIKARYDALFAQMQLRAAVGTLDETLVEQVAALMSPPIAQKK